MFVKAKAKSRETQRLVCCRGTDVASTLDAHIHAPFFPSRSSALETASLLTHQNCARTPAEQWSTNPRSDGVHRGKPRGATYSTTQAAQGIHPLDTRTMQARAPSLSESHLAALFYSARQRVSVHQRQTSRAPFRCHGHGRVRSLLP